MNIANKITSLRIVLALVCMWLVVKNTLFFLSAGFLVFILASLTDLFDGILARSRGIVSDLGKILDPIADKVLILGVFLAFVEIRAVHSWMVILIMFREFLITGIRIFALRKGRVLAAQRFGKHKTFSQMLGIIIIFSVLITNKIPSASGKYFLPAEVSNNIVFWLMLWIVFITLLSGGVYLWKNRKIIKSL